MSLPVKPHSSHRTTSVQFLSGLGLDSIGYHFDITPAAPILILSDVGRLADFESYSTFLAACCTQFDHVLLIFGPREFHGSSQDEILQSVHELAIDWRLGNLVIMDRRRFDVPHSDVTILGCTLSRTQLPSARVAPDLTARDDGEKPTHDDDMIWLRESLYEMQSETPRRRCIVATIDPPTCPPRMGHNAAAPCFCNNAIENLPKFERAATVDFWIHGHSKQSCAFNADRTRVISNQRCIEAVKLSWWKKKSLFRAFDPKATITL